MRDLTFKKSAKATLSASHLRTQIVEINGIEVTPSHVRYRIVADDRGTPIPGSLADVVLTMDSAATRKPCSDKTNTKCLGFGSPLQRVSDGWFRGSSRLQGSEISKNPGLIAEHREKVEAVAANGSVFAHHHDARFTIKE